MVDVSLVNVCKTYKGGQNVVKDFNLDIKDRELIIFVGPSDCGKSTTLRMIARLEDISSGELRMDDCLMNMAEPKNRSLSIVSQNYALYPYMTVYENVVFGLRARRIPSGEIDVRVREAAQIPEISHLLDRRPAALSGGQKQGVAIGSVIAGKPKAHLIDEPLSNLDAKLRVQMRMEIAKLHEQLGATIIYVTHGQVEAMTPGTRIVVMNRGTIQQIVPPAELYRNPVNIFVAGFIGSPAMNFLDVDVLEEDGTVWLLGQEWRLPLEGHQASRLKDKGYTGKRITLGIRPEDLHQEKCSGRNGSSGLNGDDSGWIGAYTSVRGMLGSEMLPHGNTGDTGQLSAGMSAPCRVKPGELLRLYVDMFQIKLLDIQTEKNILLDQETVMKSDSLLKKAGPYRYILPAPLVFAVLLFYPFFKIIYLSFYETNKMEQAKLFAGLGNYVEPLKSVSFYNSLVMTFLFVVIVVVGSMVLGLPAVVLCNKAFPGIRISSTVYALLMATASGSAAMILKIILHPPTGITNKLLGLNISWINAPKYALACVALLTARLNSGISFPYFSAELSNIDDTIHKRTSVDGANGTQKFLRLTLPDLSPIMFYTIIVNIIQAFQSFGQVKILIQGGPGESANLVVYSIYRDAFLNHRFGSAAAQSVTLFAIIMVMTFLIFKAEKKGVSY